MKTRVSLAGLDWRLVSRQVQTRFPSSKCATIIWLGPLNQESGWNRRIRSSQELKLHVYGVTGNVGRVRVLKVDKQNEPCPDQPVVKIRLAKGEVAFAANWNPLPRRPKSVDAKAQQRVEVVRQSLREHGFRDPIVHIGQMVSVDLDGDGEGDFVIAATHYKNGDEIPDESSANAYSFVMVERVIEGATKNRTRRWRILPRS